LTESHPIIENEVLPFVTLPEIILWLFKD